MEPVILYSDMDTAVVMKPSLWLSEEAEDAASLPAFLRLRLSGEIYPVHRLDKETAGVMVYARNAEAAARLSKAFREKATEKLYSAVTDKALGSPLGAMEDLLFRDRRRGKSFVVKRLRAGVKRACLSYRLLGEREGFFLYEVRLSTGRTHQIRVQFASRGCPLCGDSRYGGRRDMPLSLAAVSLSFPHPKTGERALFSAEPSASHPAFSLFRENFSEQDEKKG